MLVFSEMMLHPGGDPSKLAQYIALGEELGKLNHPACPDVDWVWVEYQCLDLFQGNGVDLQSSAALMLARTHIHGLPGMEQGLLLITALLSRHWLQLWPVSSSARVQMLAWLFVQLRPLVRRLQLLATDLPLANRINGELASLNALLVRHEQLPLVPLEAMRLQFGSLIKRLEKEASPREEAIEPRQSLPDRPAMSKVAGSGSNVLIFRVAPPSDPTPAQEPSRKTRPGWLLVPLMLLIGLLWYSARRDQLDQAKLPEPVHLDSLLLFAPGSAELKPESTKVLINGLMHIKAQADWLIVVSGHSDNSGNTGQNLELSRARATAVRDWMQQMGDLPDSCFAVRGLGASQPIARNDTEEGRSANRRVDIQLVPQVGACVL